MSAELEQIKDDYARMAIDYVSLQDRLEKAIADCEAAKRKVAQYDSDTLQLSKQLASDNAQLRKMLDRAREAHPLSSCAEENCPLCAALFPRLSVVPKGA